MPIFRFDKAFNVAPQGVKALYRKRRELSRVKEELAAAKDEAERSEHRKRKKTVQQEILQLERELHATKEVRAAGEKETGALPDFVLIGGKKCGTTFFYDLLAQHPHVEHAAAKELHFFNAFFDEGVEWYRRCFPTPKWKDGRRSITGEGTPEYLHHPLAPERMAQVIPQARLIALLRNPIDRTYSDYQMIARKGRETRTFEEAVGLEGPVGAREVRSLGKAGGTLEPEDRTGLGHARRKYLSKSIYVDPLQRWSTFFSEEQMLVLKSEDFFERPVETLKVTLDFLDLPEWEPQAPRLRRKRDKNKYDRNKLNKGQYEEMDPATRRRLEEFFEPHNQRLYEHLGVDFGW